MSELVAVIRDILRGALPLRELPGFVRWLVRRWRAAESFCWMYAWVLTREKTPGAFRDRVYSMSMYTGKQPILRAWAEYWQEHKRYWLFIYIIEMILEIYHRALLFFRRQS